MDCAKTAALKKTLQKEKDLHAATRQLLEEEKASTAEKCEQATQELNDEKDFHAATRQLLEEEKASTAEKCEQATQELNDEKTCMQ